MTQFMNNVFESLTNSCNPQYAGVPPAIHTPFPSQLEVHNQSLAQPNGLTPTLGLGALFNGHPV